MTFIIKTVIALILILLTLSQVECSIQSVAVKGKLNCEGKPYPNALIKLYDVDVGMFHDHCTMRTYH